ncbi:MAG: porin family protein, partial [Microvirga sp.]
MKKLLLSATALIALTAAAGAADLPMRSAPPPVIAVVPIFTWTGFYAGVNGGYGWNANSGRTVFVPGVGAVDVGGNNDGGFVGGGQIGYNYQIGQFVIGVETDIQWSDLGGNNNNNLYIGSGFAGGGGGGIDWFGTVRARAGVAFDRVLVYATGGFAYATGSNDDNGCFVGTAYAGCGGGDNSVTGWTVGAGVEWALP